MDINEIRKLTLPELRERAKEISGLEGVMGMKKPNLIEAIAKAEGISSNAPAKEVTTISSVKEELRALKEQKQQILTSTKDRSHLERIRKKQKRLKRLTRKLALVASRQAAAKAIPPAEAPAAKAPAG